MKGDAKAKQALSAGSTLEQRYLSELGGFSGVMSVDPTSALMLLAGRTGSGKSSFLQSCPSAYIINADCSSTPSRARALIWPGIRRDGRPVEIDPNSSDPSNPENGVPISIDWATILKKKELLIRLAEEDVPGRPQIVALDTVDTASRMVEEWMVAQWNEEHPSNQKTDFGEIGQGQQYREMENHILNFALDLRRVGYGVALVFHLGDRSYYVERQRQIDRNVPRVRDQLWNAVIGVAEVVLQFDMTDEAYTKKVKLRNPDGSFKMKDGKPITKPITVTRRVCFVRDTPSAENPRINADIKSRWRHLPSVIRLDDRNPWATYEDEVRKAILKEQQYEGE